MKKYFIYANLILLSLYVISCDENELLQYDQTGDKSVVQFVEKNGNLRVGQNAEASIEIKISTSTISNVDRTVNISIDTELTTAESENYSLPSNTAIIPANSYEGTFVLVGIDNDNIDDTGKEVAIKIESFGNANVLDGFGTQIVKIFEICPNSFAELVLDFADGYPEEISWEVKNEDGVVITSVGEGYYPSGTVNATEMIELQGAGDYTFTIFDAYGDGLWNGTVAGSYELKLCVETLAAGAGNFGSNQSTPFHKY